MRKLLLFLVVFIFITVGCGSNEEEADYNYQNALEHYNTIVKEPNKKSDALYFFLLASENDKYRNVATAKYIYSLAAQILIANNNLTTDDNIRLRENIITGVEILTDHDQVIYKVELKERVDEAKNIINAVDPIYSFINSLLAEKAKSTYKKLNEISRMTPPEQPPATEE